MNRDALLPEHDRADVVSPTPEQHLLLACRALDEEDPKHAAHHLAAVLALDPAREGLDDAIERWTRLAEDPLSLVPIGDSVFAGDAALRAFALAELGRPAEAAVLLLRVQVTRPEAPYIDRVRDWLSCDGAVGALDLPAFSVACSECVVAPQLAAALLPLLERVLVEREPHDMIAFNAIRAARNAGQLERATAIARTAEARAPSFWTAIGRAMAARARDARDEAVAAYREAANRDSTDVSALLDIGDITLDDGQLGQARAAYEEALAREPAQRWAVASLLFMKWRYEGDAAAAQRLRSLAAGDATSRAAHLAARMDAHATQLVVPASAIMNGIRYSLNMGDAARKLAVSSLEAPSVVLATELALRRRAFAMAEIEFGQVPSPDPRVPRRRVDFVLWNYRATGVGGLFGGRTAVARVGVSPPGESITRGIDAIASSDYDLAAWAVRARELASQLAIDCILEVASTMVHPGDPPDDMDAFEWVFRRQIAAALTMAHVDKGWKGSRRQDALLTLLYGPVDWTATAALVAMIEIARNEPAHTSEIMAMLREELEGVVNPIRWSCIQQPLLDLLERLPIEDDLRKLLARMRAESESRE